MSVRFVIGRAGAGKTYHCLSAVRAELSPSPLDGPRLILLVPEQASLQTERALLALLEPAVTHRAEALSFRRLALRISASAGAQTRSALSVNGRAMILRHLLGKLEPELQFFKNVERFPGLLDGLGHSIDELINEAVTAEEIGSALAAPDDDPLRRSKLLDLRRIFAAYLESLGPHRLDPSQALEAARGAIPNCDWLQGARVWVDGFAGFTRQERLTLVELGRVVARLEVTLLLEPRHATLEELSALDPSDLWAKTARTYLELKRPIRDAGVEVEPPVILTPAPPPRYHAAPQLAELEQRVFEQAAASQPVAGSAVQVIRASSRRVEVAFAVAQIVRLVQSDEALRYRDIGITVRDLEPYHDLLSAALQARGIPYFIDRRRPTCHHPLVEWLRSFVQLPLEPLASAAVRLFLKTGLVDLGPDECDLLENHLIATELSGLDAWSAPWRPLLSGWEEGDRPSKQRAAAERLERLNRARQALLDQLEPWLRFARSEPTPTSRQWSEGLSEHLERLGVLGRVEQWVRSAEDEGDLDRAEEHRQMVRDVTALLDDLAEVLPEEPFTCRRLAQMLESALAQLTLGLTPPTLDQVLVTGIERSRNPDLKVLFLLGFNDGSFPAAPREDAIINDEDRTWLSERGLKLGAPSKERLLDERFLAYVAFTRPSQKLIISYAAADEDERELLPSPYLSDLYTVCPGASPPMSVEDPFRHRSTWNVHAASDLAAHLAYEFASRPPLPQDATDQRKLWNALYGWARQEPANQAPLRQALGALVYENHASLQAGSVAKLYPETLHTSVSRLETFATCPFKHFAEWNLRLEPRRTVRLQPVDIGRVCHAVLEDFIKRLIADGRSLVELGDEELRDRLQASLDAMLGRLPEAAAASLARDRFVIARSRAQIERVLRTQQTIAALGSFRPREAELRFGFEEGEGLGPLEIDTPDGRRVLLRGVIDRVDLADGPAGRLGMVIDYKRTRDKRLDLAGVYHGLSLQLLAYLLVLRQHGERLAGGPIEPAGALYVSLFESYDRVEHPEDAADDQGDPSAGTFRPRGLLNLDHVGTLDHAFAESGRSGVYQVTLRKDGGLSNVNTSDAAPREDFDRLLEHTGGMIGRHADAILDGKVEVEPYRLGTFSPCSWCDLWAVCRFESPTSRVRSLDRLNRTAIFESLKK